MSRDQLHLILVLIPRYSAPLGESCRQASVYAEDKAYSAGMSLRSLYDQDFASSILLPMGALLLMP